MRSPVDFLREFVIVVGTTSGDDLLELLQKTLQVLQENRRTCKLSDEDLLFADCYVLSFAEESLLSQFLTVDFLTKASTYISREEIQYLKEEIHLIQFGVRRN